MVASPNSSAVRLTSSQLQRLQDSEGEKEEGEEEQVEEMEVEEVEEEGRRQGEEQQPDGGDILTFFNTVD